MYKKGVSGNPGGRPKAEGQIKELARKHTAEAIKRLVEWMRTSNPKASVTACTALLDRAYGRPAQALTNADGGNLVIQFHMKDESVL